MTNPTQDSLDYVARLNGWASWEEAQAKTTWQHERAMRLHALDRDKWIDEMAVKDRKFTQWRSDLEAAERQPVNWQGNMDFEPSEGAKEKAVDVFTGSWTTAVARLIDHLEGTAPEKVDRDREALQDLLDAYSLGGFSFALAKFKEYKNG